MRFIKAARLAAAIAMSCVLLTAPAPRTAMAAQAAAGGLAMSEIAVLDPGDVDRYRKIFDLQDDGQMARADLLIRDLQNPVLMGYVLFQRYLHATAYRSRYDELYNWMAQYSDLPGAARIYALALKRRPKGADAPDRPEPRTYRARASDALETPSPRKMSPKVERVAGKVRQLVRDERPTQALGYLQQSSVQRVLGKNEADDLTALIASSYYAEGKADMAYALSSDVAIRNRHEVPLADWTAGLSAWRMGDRETAASHFEALADAPTVTGSARAAGAFWAARAYLSNHEPQKVAPLLEKAADASHSFYGVLATRQLGRDLPFEWTTPALTRSDFQALAQEPAVLRAIAFVQIGDPASAEDELFRIHGRIPDALEPAFLALANTLNLPAIQLEAAECLSASGYDIGRYPVPSYAPAGGFDVDPALLYAFMHQESRFKVGAESGSGARGLMQLMPRTASHVADDPALARGDKDRLLDPSTNLSIAQDYLKTLMGMVEPRGNLFMLAVAYNGGPGNLSRWRRTLNIDDDPLLFIESIPAAETRAYIERVLTNYWAYRDRLEGSDPTLDEAAANQWPVYSNTNVVAPGPKAGR